MSYKIFAFWLKAFDLRVDGRRVSLILDNYTAHIQVKKFAEHNVTLRSPMPLHLPPNLTSKTHLRDTGIIQNFKA